MFDVLILGASGYVGGELLRFLDGHPDLHVLHLVGDSRAGDPVAVVHPHLALAYPQARIEAWDPEMLVGTDLVFAALPHGHSQRLAPSIVDRGIPFVDLGADFRLSDAETYTRWHGDEHSAPDLLQKFVYGIPELNREKIRATKCTAAAGCYATAAILALKPLVDARLVDPQTLIVDAASGVSGAGRGAKEETGFSTIAESMSAYGLLTHRHTAEMQEAIGGRILFTPHLAPMNRGILATCYAQASGPMSADAPLDALRAAYADEAFVHVSQTPPATKWTLGSNAVHLTARYDERTGRVLAIAALDNLGKGAAGQMIQCANLMLGLDETAGLTTCGVFP